MVQPDCLRCLLLRPWTRRSRDQGAPHDPQQMQETQENWLRRDLGLPASRHVQRSGIDHLQNRTKTKIINNASPLEQDNVCLGQACAADRVAGQCWLFPPPR